MSCPLIGIYGTIFAEVDTVDTRKIGEFLKTLRKEKGLTQEQLAEILFVSGRTVSRWETGTNLPDLSILLQIAAYYDVEVKEILDGKRKNKPMENEFKETMQQVADYAKLEKEQSMKVGNRAFVITFAACAAAMIVQLIAFGELTAGLGETATLFVGGIAYTIMMLRNGLAKPDSSLKEACIGIFCATGSTIVMILRALRLGMPPARIVHAAAAFFVGISLLGFSLMKIIYFINHKGKSKHDKQ